MCCKTEIVVCMDKSALLLHCDACAIHHAVLYCLDFDDCTAVYICVSKRHARQNLCLMFKAQTGCLFFAAVYEKSQCTFSAESPGWGHQKMALIAAVNDPQGGFVIDDTIYIGISKTET